MKRNFVSLRKKSAHPIVVIGDHNKPIIEIETIKREAFASGLAHVAKNFSRLFFSTRPSAKKIKVIAEPIFAMAIEIGKAMNVNISVFWAVFTG